MLTLNSLLAVVFIYFVVVSTTPIKSVHDEGVSIALSKRSNLHFENGVVNLEALRNQLSNVQNKYSRNLKQYEANTGKPHSLAAGFFRNLEKRDTGSNALTDVSQNMWYGTVHSYTVDFDTGSSDFFLPDPSCFDCGSHHTYDPSQSSTSTYLGNDFFLSYGDGSESFGMQYNDAVSVSGLTVQVQTLGAAVSYSVGFERMVPDGLMGLAWPQLSDFPATPFIFNLYDQGTLSSNSFSFKLAESGSSLFIGGADSSLYTGSFSYTPVTEQGFWQVTADALLIGDTVIANDQDSVVDSGTTLVIVDPITAGLLYSNIPGAQKDSSVGRGIYTMPCDNVPSNVKIIFAGQTVTIPPDVFNFGPLSQGSTTCIGGVAAGKFGFWILGDVFMRNVYTQFDMENYQVGIAALA